MSEYCNDYDPDYSQNRFGFAEQAYKQKSKVEPWGNAEDVAEYLAKDPLMLSCPKGYNRKYKTEFNPRIYARWLLKQERLRKRVLSSEDKGFIDDHADFTEEEKKKWEERLKYESRIAAYQGVDDGRGGFGWYDHQFNQGAGLHPLNEEI